MRTGDSQAPESIHWGVQLGPQYTDWPTLKRIAVLVDDTGYDSLWTWDHLFAHAPGKSYPGAEVLKAGHIELTGVVIQPDGPNYECWQLLAAWAAITKHVRIGSLASCNPHRHPGLLAKMVSTLDHISGGRAILGLAAGGLAHEHRAFGLSEGDGLGTRISRLAEATELIRRLLKGETVTYRGQFYHLTGATVRPLPVQEHLPILIPGGGGERMRSTISRFADLWMCPGSPEMVASKIAAMRTECEAAGRDPSSVVVLAGGEGYPGFVDIVVRGSDAAIDARLREVAEHNHMDFVPVRTATMGNPERVARRLFDYCKAGVGGFIVGFAPPDDEETIERLAAEVRPRLEVLRRSSN